MPSPELRLSLHGGLQLVTPGSLQLSLAPGKPAFFKPVIGSHGLLPNYHDLSSLLCLMLRDDPYRPQAGNVSYIPSLLFPTPALFLYASFHLYAPCIDCEPGYKMIFLLASLPHCIGCICSSESVQRAWDLGGRYWSGS